MAFFKSRAAAPEGVDPSRIPPGQYVTDRFPVLHAGSVPRVDPEDWEFSVDGLVSSPATFTLDEIKAMPAVDKTLDIHCVTKWSKLDTRWHGIEVAALLGQFDIDPSATHVLVSAEHGFTANIPLDDLLRPDNLLAWQFDGQDLEPEHGWPLRLVVPHLYFWKSVKWVRGFRLMDHDEPGFWERNGYHMYGDPFREQRYWGD